MMDDRDKWQERVRKLHADRMMMMMMMLLSSNFVIYGRGTYNLSSANNDLLLYVFCLSFKLQQLFSRGEFIYRDKVILREFFFLITLHCFNSLSAISITNQPTMKTEENSISCSNNNSSVKFETKYQSFKINL